MHDDDVMAIADTVYMGGTIVTMTTWAPGDRWARCRAGAPTALAVRADRVLAVGTDAELARLVGPVTEVVELHGRTVVPGIIDNHLHLVSYGMTGWGFTDVGARRVPAWPELATVFDGCAVDDSGWIRGFGWDDAALGRDGTRDDIDAALRRAGLEGTPCALFDATGHRVLLGSAALAAAGLGDDVTTPHGGTVVRDDHGRLTGLFTDAALTLVTAAIPPVPADALARAILDGQADLVARGITSITDPGVGAGGASLLDGSPTDRALDAYADLAADGRLRLRVDVLLLFSGTGGASVEATRAGLESGARERFVTRGIEPTQLRVQGVKVFADGIPRSHTAWFEQPYGLPHDCGAMVVAGATTDARVAELTEIIRLVDAAGLQAGVHATGDATTHAAIDAMIAATRSSGSGLHHYAIHADFIDVARLPRLAAAGIGLSTNPDIARSSAPIGPGLVGEQRHNARQPVAAALDAGVLVTIASDAPVVAPDWRSNLHAAITRPFETATAPASARRPTTLDALATMTVLPARLDGSSDWRGNLRPGAMADLVVLDASWPDDEHPDALLELGVDETVIGGETVYRRAPTVAPATSSVAT